MMNKQSSSNNNVNQEAAEYKITCAGLRCNNRPTNYLKLALIKKSGWFCSTCKKSLEEDGLIEGMFDESIKMGGESNSDLC